MKTFLRGAIVGMALIVSSVAGSATTISNMTLAEYWATISSHWWDFVGTYTGSDLETVNSGFVPSTTIAFVSQNVYSWTLTITSLTAQGTESFTNYLSYYQTSPNFVPLGTVVGTIQPGSTVSASLAVPSPIAGAGLPFLLAGAALVMRRRNENRA